MHKIKDKIPKLQFYQGEKPFRKKNLDLKKKKSTKICFIA